MRISAQIFVSVLLALLCAPARAGDTWCESDEVVAFSCSIDRKTASLCVRRDASKSVTALQYRFGVLGKKAELIFPKSGEMYLDLFTAHYDSWPKGSYARISFTRGSFSYTVYSRHAIYLEHARSDGSGVRVKKGGVEVADLWCGSEGIQDNIWNYLGESGLKETPRDAL